MVSRVSGKGRSFHLLRRVLDRDQQRLRTGTRQRGKMLDVRFLARRRPRNQGRAIVDGGHAAEQRGSQFKKITAYSVSAFSFIHVKIGEDETIARMPCSMQKDSNATGESLHLSPA